MHQTYAWPDGSTTIGVYPSKYFDPATASDARIAQFPWGPRPSSTAPSYSDWLQAARYSETPPLTPPARLCPRPGVNETDAYAYTGYAAQAAAGKTFDGAHSSYTAPAVYESWCLNDALSEWVGVSDALVFNSLIVQAGLTVDEVGGYVGGWYEVYGGTWNTQSEVPIPVTYVAGHRYYFDVHYADAQDWAYQVTDLDDSTNHYSSFIHHSTGGGTQYINPIGHFVSERPMFNGQQDDYMGHSDTRFRTATVHITGEGDARMSIERPEALWMKNGSTLLGTSDSLDVTNSNFTAHWKNCH
jgi:hypothetical protein